MRTPFTLHLALLCSAVLTCTLACEKESPPPAPESPPQWVVEANERARKQQDEDETETPEPERERLIEHPYLWRVTGDDGVTSHIFGSFDFGISFHSLDELPDSVRSAFEESTTLVTEVDGDDWNEISDEVALVPSGNGLRERLSKEQWDELVALADVPAEVVEILRPFMVAGIIHGERFEEEEPNMDRRFGVLARAHEMEQDHLLSQDEAFRFMGDLITADDIVPILEKEQEIRRDRAQALKMFRAGTADEVTDFVPMFNAAFTDRELELINERNRSWAEKLAQRLQTQGGLFVSISARRVVGPGGLPALLAKNPALKVERLDAPPSDNPNE